MHRLPGRIAAVMVGTVLVFILTIAVALTWMSHALNRQAHDNAFIQIENARTSLLDQTRLLMLDYAKWEAGVPLVRSRDLSWIYDNIGSTAVAGVSFQLAVLWGGPFADDVGWQEEGGSDPRSGLFASDLLDMVEAHLRRIPLNLYRGTEFFIWHGNAVYTVAAARVEADAPDAVADLISRDDTTPRILIARRLAGSTIARTAKDYQLTDLNVVRQPPQGRSSVPLLGGDGQPVAYLAWSTPHPGTTMLRQMALPLLLVISIAVCFAGFGVGLVRRNAEHLVAAERHARTAARTDALTGLPNRAAFNEALNLPFAGERAVLFLDVNDFKRINDSIGHEAGDQVIISVAQRLARLTDPHCLLARIAGDEFVFLVTGSDTEVRTQRLAHAAERQLGAPLRILNHQIQVQMAMGYAIQLSDSTSGKDLVRQADLAMYEAKRHKGHNGLVAYSSVIDQASRDAGAIEGGLRRALARPGELSVAYQPIVGAEGQLVRAEALARWTSSELGPVTPDRFIAVAEQSGLMVELGRTLIDLVCNDLVAHPELAVSINVSPLQLMAPDFIPGLVDTFRRHEIATSRVEVELTESVLVDDARLAAQRIGELRTAGFSIALDDFGTGYSSVGYLEQLGFDTLKIDRSFVSKIRDSAKGIAVVDGMIRMAHGLNLRVVCEGIEAAEELELLRELGSDLAQGYHLDRPLPIEALAERWLRQAGRHLEVA
ncbi:bifunctional diguanylate cyclase/phosphodiesterase [Rubellimicrobium rubrum]|uniref:Bifunctional diguanylate cyclase/phosphodiesterase n=1 Tax=Rubellimicrobium rubrum TaxID=2585369 RepID=A0A5C4N5M4_9RHOB|nr:bifunctional diguanylate cyclase/phosphodiesterase [Rubellimicrobium rubrum]TNC51939.1 bifunctional diguanylate cyclase/phosphodiesterase [Rubellimicrobium rubrum]